MKGRKPKPIALHELNGNPSKINLKKLKRIEPDSSMPKCPTWFDYWGRKEWQRVCPQLYNLGLLKNIDEVALSGYCAAYSRWVRAEKALIEDGGSFTYQYFDAKTFKLKRVNKPEVIIARDALNQVKQFCAEFGLTPSSRGRMVLPSEKKETDPFDELLEYCNETTKKDV